MKILRKIIGFEADPPEDFVIFAVAPIDAVTGRIVRFNITASISVNDGTASSKLLQLPDKPIRNRSGLLVFVREKNSPIYPKYRIDVKAKAAGYFDPEPIDFIPPQPDSAFNPRDRLRVDFQLFPRPGSLFQDEATLISGVVLRGVKSVEGARISAKIPVENQISTNSFETRSDERGAFALALRVPRFAEDGGSHEGTDNSSDKGVSVEFKIETRRGNDEWQSDFEMKDLKVIESRRHVFKSPIDLDKSAKPLLLIT
jgi:hypothetical protein